MTPDRRKEIARAGGLAVHRQGKAHTFTSEEARIAGKKGGKATAQRGREYMAAIGRRGGQRASQREDQAKASGCICNGGPICGYCREIYHRANR